MQVMKGKQCSSSADAPDPLLPYILRLPAPVAKKVENQGLGFSDKSKCTNAPLFLAAQTLHTPDLG
jgi:hypothetical protein